MSDWLQRAALAGVVTCALACGSAAPPATRPTAPAAPPAQRPAGITTPAVPVEVPVPTGSVTGRITSQADGAPLARARVILNAAVADESRVTITGADGRFRFDKLASGSYSLSVTRSGFAPAQYGERRSAPPAVIAVSDGQAVTGVDVALFSAGVIVGQILDEDDRPFTGAIVEALVSRTVEGRTTFVPVATAQTDDRGGFRLTGLAAGQYYVSAFDPAFSVVSDETGPLRYTPTYYPGVSFAEEATRVSVSPGVEPDVKIVFHLKIVRPARLTGTLRTQDARQLVSGAVVMMPIRGEGLATLPSQDVSILPDGSFVFRNVPPGQYLIRARGDVEEEGVTRFATFRVRVEGRDLDNIEMTLVPGATVHGHIVVEAARRTPPPPWRAVRVRAPFVDGTSFGDTLDGQVQEDGTYGIHGVMSGRHLFALDGLPYPWVLKKVTWHGGDITDAGIEAENQQEYADVRLVISDVATAVTGTVRGATQAPVAGALVLIIPPASQFWTRTSRRFGLTRSDAAGRFEVRGLPPGEYRAVAVQEIDESEAYRQDVARPLAGAGLPVSLTENAVRHIDLPLTSLVALTQAAAR